MNATIPIFEIHERSGKCYRIWPDGRIEGFPYDAFVINRIWPLWQRTLALERQPALMEPRCPCGQHTSASECMAERPKDIGRIISGGIA